MENDKKWINLSYVLIAMILSWVINQIASIFIHSFHLPNPLILEVVSVSALLSVVAVSAFVFVYTRRPSVQTYSVEVCQELRKVTWPTAKMTYMSTIVVVVAVLFMAVVLGLFDWVCAKVVNWVIQA